MNYQTGDCTCSDCRANCANKPGWFTPDQIGPLAANLGLTSQQLFDEHLQVDWWVDDPDVFVLSPRLKHGRGGTMMPGRALGECHWYVDGRCAVHALGKPFECQQSGHADVPNPHEAAADRWRPEEHQRMITDLYGGEPFSEGTSLFDILGMWMGGR